MVVPKALNLNEKVINSCSSALSVSLSLSLLSESLLFYCLRKITSWWLEEKRLSHKRNQNLIQATDASVDRLEHGGVAWVTSKDTTSGIARGQSTKFLLIAACKQPLPLPFGAIPGEALHLCFAPPMQNGSKRESKGLFARCSEVFCQIPSPNFV